MRRTSARLAQLRLHLDRVKWRDKQAAEAYWTLVLAQPRTRYVLTPYDAVLKDYYNADKIAEMACAPHPFFSMLKREVDGAVKSVSRKLNRVMYVIPTEHCPPGRAYMLTEHAAVMAKGLSAWAPEGDLDKSATFKTEDNMARIEERVVREFPEKIQTNPPNNAYREGWERVFGEKKEEPVKECTGFYDDGVMPTQCQNREGCGREGCPAAFLGVTPER